MSSEKFYCFLINEIKSKCLNLLEIINNLNNLINCVVCSFARRQDNKALFRMKRNSVHFLSPLLSLSLFFSHSKKKKHRIKRERTVKAKKNARSSVPSLFWNELHKQNLTNKFFGNLYYINKILHKKSFSK